MGCAGRKTGLLISLVPRLGEEEDLRGHVLAEARPGNLRWPHQTQCPVQCLVSVPKTGGREAGGARRGRDRGKKMVGQGEGGTGWNSWMGSGALSGALNGALGVVGAVAHHKSVGLKQVCRPIGRLSSADTKVRAPIRGSGPLNRGTESRPGLALRSRPVRLRRSCVARHTSLKTSGGNVDSQGCF